MQDDTKQLQLQIKELEEKLSYIRKLLYSRQLEPADFRDMKTNTLLNLRNWKQNLNANNHNKVNFNDLLKKGVNNLLKLDYIYENGDTEKKIEMISSMYPEKMTFDGFSVRTIRINEVAKLIYSMDMGFSENKNRTNQNNSVCPVKSGRQDSNLRPPDPQPGALPACATSRKNTFYRRWHNWIANVVEIFNFKNTTYCTFAQLYIHEGFN